MNEIRIADVITKMRRDKGITQEELAEYMGVSKAAVSKWEKIQSYPDITLLPRLAAYFNITVDELLKYSPQLSLNEIRKLCKKLSAEFSNKPFDEAMSCFREAIKEYYSCFELLNHAAMMLVNHSNGIPKENHTEIIKEAKELCERVVAECGDPILTRSALLTQCLCSLFLEQPDEVFSVLGESLNTPPLLEGSLIAKAYLLMENRPKAKEVYQCDIYNLLFPLIESMIGYLHLIEDDFVPAQAVFILFPY